MSERLSLPESVNRVEQVRQLVWQRMPEFSEFSPEARENALVAARVLFVDNLYHCLAMPIPTEKKAGVKTMKEVENLLHGLINGDIEHGLEREGDDKIWEEVENRVLESSKPVQVLEVGAGSSLPYGSFNGSPWLARAMALHFGESVKIKVTDKFGDDLSPHSGYVYYFVSKDGQVILENPDPFSNYLTKAIELPPESDRFTPFSPQTLVGSVNISSSRVNLLGGSTTGRAYLRPCLDPTLERGFGLKTAFAHYSVMPTELNGQFDLVFARFLPPNASGPLGPKVDQCLKAGGEKIINVDLGKQN